MTYDLIDGKVCQYGVFRNVSLRVVCLLLRLIVLGRHILLFPDGSKELVPTYQSVVMFQQMQVLNIMAPTDLRNPVTLTADRLEGVGATDMFVDIDVPDGVSLANQRYCR